MKPITLRKYKTFFSNIYSMKHAFSKHSKTIYRPKNFCSNWKSKSYVTECKYRLWKYSIIILVSLLLLRSKIGNFWLTFKLLFANLRFTLRRPLLSRNGWMFLIRLLLFILPDICQDLTPLWKNPSWTLFNKNLSLHCWALWCLKEPLFFLFYNYWESWK